MMTSGRNLIVLSDGTGNSAATAVQDKRLASISSTATQGRLGKLPCSATASALRA